MLNVRVTGVVVEDGRVLLLDQNDDNGRSWSLPGGKIDPGETMEQTLIREMREETGLEVGMGRLLYICDHIPEDGEHLLHITFETRRIGGVLGDVAEGTDSRPIRGVKFVKVSDLPAHGFTERFAELVQAGFPQAGSYMGPKANIGL